jgi:hypothetical protein
MTDKKYTFFNDKPFYVLLVENGDFQLNKYDWNNPNYIQNLISQPFISTHQVTSDSFFPFLKEKLKLKDDNLVVTQIIGEEPGHNYELLYIDSTFKNSGLEINHFNTLLNSNGEVIYGPAVIIKNYVSTLENKIYFEDMTSNELYKVLHDRGFNKVLSWNDEAEKWSVEEVYGPIDKFAETFFEGEKYQTSEIAFLKHNLNILYLKSQYGKDNIMGSLLNCKVEKILVYTMLTNEIRGNLTIDELQKIIKLSLILTPPFKPENKWFEDEKDEHGRTIIKNRFRVLDSVFKDNISNT